ncbi:BolA family transcriptional regulator [Jannaschia sp. Os4]|uniref:BolA family protein n=1 Tax=Jannaschia sp. Os4 TaxID=2807617 RepID=UPI00193A5B0C|nr:BolA family protein [Jannaschia sp. Os4]MBM2577514.1 BolA family transcriptional regulator [Jannaschia sp. Os4]
MSIEAEMRERLQALQPTRLEVVNQSHLHAGHAGDDGSGESHWHVALATPRFEGVGRVQRHRMVHAALGDVVGRIHALSLDLSA